MPDKIKTEDLFLETVFEGNDRIFYLYKSKYGSSDTDFLISETRIDIYGKEKEIKIYLPKIENFE